MCYGDVLRGITGCVMGRTPTKSYRIAELVGGFLIILLWLQSRDLRNKLYWMFACAFILKISQPARIITYYKCIQEYNSRSLLSDYSVNVQKASKQAASQACQSCLKVNN